MDRRPAEFTKSLMMARGLIKKSSKHKGGMGGAKGNKMHHGPSRKVKAGMGRGKGARHNTGASYFGGRPGSFDRGKGRALD